MSRRPPSQPPQIDGFTPIKVLGSGGFADVFLYQQQLPERQVAVKVLLAEAVGDSGRAQFVAEANLMAKLSAHPSIVTIYQANTAPDSRPYLVMEYCPRPNLSVRYRTERIGVAEALRIAVRLAGAVETAHRAGILHRDIKPANVLTTDYGWPALTDFGISVATAAIDDAEQAGLSIPWAAPEFFIDDAPRGPAADIYALAATIYTILAGRSPFEAAPGANSALELIGRIERSPLPAIGRDDVPAQLEDILRQGMAKSPARRFSSAAAFARAIQQVEQDLQLTMTSLDIPDTSRIPEEASGAEQRTRVRSISSISPGTVHRPAIIDPAGATRARPHTIDTGDATRRRPTDVTSGGDEPGSATTRRRGVTGAPDQAVAAQADVAAEPSAPAGAGLTGAGPQPQRAGRLRSRTGLIVAAVAAVVIAVVVVMALGAANRPDDPQPTIITQKPTQTAEAADPPPAPTKLTLTRHGSSVKVSWHAPKYDSPLDYGYTIVDGADNSMKPVGSHTSFTLDDAPGHVCVRVASIDTNTRKTSRPEDSPTKCV